MTAYSIPVFTVFFSNAEPCGIEREVCLFFPLRKCHIASYSSTLFYFASIEMGSMEIIIMRKIVKGKMSNNRSAQY